MVASSIFIDGVNVPVHVVLLPVVIVDNIPFTTVISALLNPATASEKVSVTVAVSPAFKALSLNTKDDTVGEVLSTVILAPDVGNAVTTLPAISVPVASANVCVPAPVPTVQAYV